MWLMFFRKCSLDFGMGVLGREKGRKKIVGEIGEIRWVCFGLEILDGGKKREREMGVGVGFLFFF